MKSRGIAAGLLIAAVALVVAFLAAPAGAQDYPPAGPLITCNPCTLPAGSDTVVTISGFNPGEVTISLGSVVLGTITADANGAGSATFTIPVGTAVGDYTLTGTQGDLVATTTLTVIAADAPDAPDVAAAGDLPRTGSDGWLPMAQTAVAALAVGGLMVLVANKRRQRVAI